MIMQPGGKSGCESGDLDHDATQALRMTCNMEVQALGVKGLWRWPGMVSTSVRQWGQCEFQ